MNKQEYLFILQGDMTPFQRATIAKWIHNKACQLNIGYACNYHGDGGDGEITYSQMMDKKSHPLTESQLKRLEPRLQQVWRQSFQHMRHEFYR